MFGFLKKQAKPDYSLPGDFESRYNIARLLIVQYFEVLLKISIKETKQPYDDRIESLVAESFRAITGEPDKRELTDDEFIETLEARENADELIKNAMQDEDFREFVVQTLRLRDRELEKELGEKYMDSDEHLAHESIYIKFGNEVPSGITDGEYEKVLRKFILWRQKAKEQGLLD